MSNRRRMLLGMLVLLISAAWVNSAWGQPVSTKPPALYQKRLASQLKPLEEVLKNLPAIPTGAEDGWTLLFEEFHLMRPDGSRLRVTHNISKALTDAGAESIGRTTSEYRKSTTKAHLVLARTILPDGTRKPVNTSACFLQTPQREADTDLYGDSEELVTVFPNVRAGSIIESIIVFEESRLRMPGQYTAVFGFEGWWPMLEKRCILEMPNAFADRLHITPLGQGVPEPTQTATDDGQRWTWTRKNIPGSRDEPAGAPFMQTGPLVYLTTLKDWPEFLHWYVPLAEKSAKLSPKFAAEVDSLTKDAKTPREILDILHGAVANEVRYVGLEFGDCDLEPHPVSEIWEHRYGDCKDKASLLRAMLRHKGIKAHMALVNTEYLGRVERRSPDYRHFNHAILVAELAEGSIFCDPTIEGSVPGLISPTDADRDVLLVTEPEQWLRTPAYEAGRYSLNFDATIAPNGELAGWATLEADGYIGTLYTAWEAKSTVPQIKERLTKRLANCYAGARVIDVKTAPHGKDEPYQIRAYFIVPAGGSLTLRFPLDAGFLPDLGAEDRPRLSDAFLWREKVETHSTFTLPPGFRAAGLPSNFQAKNPNCLGAASWQHEKGILKADLRFDTKTSRLPAAECGPFKQVLGSLRSWLDKPVTLEMGDQSSPAPAATAADELASFTQMPSGSGQLELVNQRYPTNGNLKLRRAALEKTLLWFPKDDATQLAAHTQIAYVDSLEDKHEAGIQRLRTHLQSLRGKVTAEQAALADYILAVCLRNKGSGEEALTIVNGIVENEQITTFRRAWAQYQRALLLAEKDPKRAIAAALAGIALEDADASALFQQLAFLRLKLGQKSEFSADLTKYLSKESPDAADLMVDLAGTAERWTAEKPDLAPLLVAVLEKAGDAKRYGKNFAESLLRARQESGTHASLAAIRQRLKDWLAAHPKDAPQGKIPDSLKTPEDFTAAINKLLDKPEKDPPGLLHLAVESLVRFEPAGWYADRLWRAATYADYLDRRDGIEAPPPILLELLDLCDLTPPMSTPHTEGRFMRAIFLTRIEKLDEAAKVLEPLANNPDLERGYLAGAVEKYGQNCLARGDTATALKIWRKLETLLDMYSTPTELLRACLAALEAGKQDDALWFLKVLRQCEKSVIAKTTASDHVTSFLAFAKDDETAIAWWQASAKWWPAWREFEKQLASPQASSHPIDPVIPSLADLGRNLASFSRDGHKAEALDVLRSLAHAARWQPSMAVELLEFQNSLSSIGLEAWASPFRTMVISIYEAGPLPDALAQQRLLIWTAVVMIDNKQAKRAQEILAKAYRDEKAPDDNNHAIILRLWALAAVNTGQDLPDITAAMVKRLAKQPPAYQDRYRDVNSLASVYQKQGKLKEEQELWEKELATPDNLGKEASIETMQQRLDALRDGAGAGEGPARAARAWLAAKQPIWLDYVRPHDLKDEKIGNPDEAINGGGGLLIAEAVKLCLLTAQSSDQPDERRFNAIVGLAWHTAAISANLNEAKAWITALKNQKALPRRIRADLLAAFLRNCFMRDKHEAFSLFADDPTLSSLDPDQATFLAAARPYFALKNGDLNAAHTLATSLMEKQLDYYAAETVQRCITRLAGGGDFERARQLYQALGKARFIESLARERSSRQLTALKAINAAQKNRPLHEEIAALFFKTFPDAAKAPPVPAPFQNSIINLTDADALALNAQRIQRGEAYRGSLEFWSDVTDTLPTNETSAAFCLRVLSLIIEKAPDDATRATFINQANSMVDIDNAEMRTRLEATLRPARALTDAAKTQDALRLHDLHLKLRTGTPVEMFSAIESIRDEQMRFRARWRVLQACLAKNDTAGVERILDGLDNEEILSPGNIAASLKAYRLLKKTDEAELALDRLKSIIYEEVVTAWTFPWGNYALLTQSRAIQLGDAKLIPEEFNRYMDTELKNVRQRLLFLTLDARLHKRWEDCARHAAEGVRLYPTFYDFYLSLGIAQAELGKKDAAAQTLKTFLTYDHNTPDEVLAQEYVAKLAK